MSRPDITGPLRPNIASTLDPASVIVGVPALNEALHIRDCLTSLINGSPDMARVRIVVADGGSTDETREIVRHLSKEFPNIVLVDNPERLQSAAINLVGFRHALPEHQILVRCDAHSIYPVDYVLRVARSLVVRDAASLVVSMDSVGTTPFQRAAAWAADLLIGSGGSAHRGGRVSEHVDHGHHAGFCLNWFRKVGGYDQSFTHNEDAEFDHRLRQASGSIWLDADIRLDYKVRDTLPKLARQYWNYGRGRARTVMKHRMRPRLRQMLPVMCVFSLAVSLLLTPFYPILLIVPAAYFALLFASAFWVAIRERTPTGLLSGPALASMHLFWGAGFIRQLFSRTRRDADA